MGRFERQRVAMFVGAGAIAIVACGGRVAMDTLGDQASRQSGDAFDGSRPRGSAPPPPQATLQPPAPVQPPPTTIDAGCASCPTADAGTRTGKIVFITGPAKWGGWSIADADAQCQQDAVAAGWSGTFKAWLSDGTTSPAARFSHSTIPYVTPLGEVIASDWTGLTTTTLSHPIDQSADGGPAWTAGVWTGTATDGTGTGSYCALGPGGGGTGTMGDVHKTDSSWTADRTASCSNDFGVAYCFEQ